MMSNPLITSASSGSRGKGQDPFQKGMLIQKLTKLKVDGHLIPADTCNPGLLDDVTEERHKAIYFEELHG